MILLNGLAVLAAILTLAGVLQAIIGAVLARRFAQTPQPAPGTLPPISVLRPLCGDEPELEAALISCFTQDYPDFEIIFGVANAHDPAIAIADLVRARFPDRRSALVIDPQLHGANRKISNLINMLPEARHDLLLICDSDLHLAPDYLTSLAHAMEQPGTGLVTALYTGLPCDLSLCARLGATQISHQFLPGVLISRAMGRQDCLGSTSLIPRAILARIGGFEALAPHVAEDNLMSKRVQALGLGVGLATTIATAMVPEADFRSLWQHELRWTRIIRSVTPAGLASSVLQYPLFWGLLLLLLPAGIPNQKLMLFAVAWFARVCCAHVIDRALEPRAGRPTPPVGSWLLPLRDCLSVLEILASFATHRVIWRGHAMQARPVK